MSELLDTLSALVVGALIVAIIVTMVLGFGVLAIILGMYGHYFSAIICLVIQLAIWTAK